MHKVGRENAMAINVLDHVAFKLLRLGRLEIKQLYRLVVKITVESTFVKEKFVLDVGMRSGGLDFTDSSANGQTRTFHQN